MAPSSPRVRIVRALALTALLALPIVTAWNLAVTPLAPRLVAIVGPRLAGAVAKVPVVWSWTSVSDGSLRKALLARVAEANPVRPLLVRSYNQLRASLLGELTAPNMVRGEDGQIIERIYVDEYCRRRVGMADQLAAVEIPILKQIQGYYESRGGHFLFVVAPSKMGYMPEAFVGAGPCPSTDQARNDLRPRFTELLEQAGIPVIDTAGLIYRQKQAQPVGLFPRRGAHWNDLGIAIATSALVEKLNAVAGRTVAAPFTYTSSIGDVASGRDDDLGELQNQLLGPPPERTPHVQFIPGTDCSGFTCREAAVSVVGGSFIREAAEVLIRDACLPKLDFYGYLVLAREGGSPLQVIEQDLSPAQLARLRDARILILEENEVLLGRATYVPLLRDVLLKP